MIEGQLVPSAISGRYAINDPNAGRALTQGDKVQIFLGGEWIPGGIEYAGNIYTSQGRPLEHGYYFVAKHGGSCGLCIGMRVRLAE